MIKKAKYNMTDKEIIWIDKDPGAPMETWVHQYSRTQNKIHKTKTKEKVGSLKSRLPMSFITKFY